MTVKIFFAYNTSNLEEGIKMKKGTKLVKTLSSAGLNDELAQRVIDSPSLAKRLVRLIESEGGEESDRRQHIPGLSFISSSD